MSEPICIGRRVRNIHQHTNGVIYAWTDDNVLYEIHQPTQRKQQKKINPALTRCMVCHYNGGSAPTLASIKSRNSTNRIKKYLKDPTSVDPNSRMPNLNLSEEQIDGIVAALASL